MTPPPPVGPPLPSNNNSSSRHTDETASHSPEAAHTRMTEATEGDAYPSDNKHHRHRTQRSLNVAEAARPQKSVNERETTTRPTRPGDPPTRQTQVTQPLGAADRKRRIVVLTTRKSRSPTCWSSTMRLSYAVTRTHCQLLSCMHAFLICMSLLTWYVLRWTGTHSLTHSKLTSFAMCSPRCLRRSLTNPP